MMKNGRGGGVGFYIRDNLKYKIRDDLSPFIENEFESLTIELSLNAKKILLCTYYKPPTASNDSFFLNLDGLLNNLHRVNANSYVFSDTNINLLKLTNNNLASLYLDSVHSNGFLQLIGKATRIQNSTYSLIDHILCKNFNSYYKTGVILLDISDHFMTFLSIPISPPKNEKTPDNKLTRLFNLNNMSDFKNSLNQLSWIDVLSHNDVNSSFDVFWDSYSTLYDLHFPLTNFKFNKNIHGKNDFMTPGLLVSKKQKLFLHKKSLLDPLTYLDSFRTYRNIFNSLVRASKKLHYDAKFVQFAKNPKKIWNLLNEISGSKKNNKNNNIAHVNANGQMLDNATDIVNEFNSFFVNAGQNISDSVPSSSKTPESFFPPRDNPPPEFELNNINATYISDIIKSFPNKQSCDVDGLSLKLIKFVRGEISVPLAHIFDLSLTSGVFPID
jgi:hypothetical protein